jgi:predicted ATPase
MIRSLYIDNFKSLVDFRLPMAPHALGRFVCLVGLNGAGKSTVLQALDFLAHLPGGKLQDWLDRREWKPSDLTSRFLKRQLIAFRLEFEFAGLGPVIWEGAFNTVQRRCTSETLSAGGQVVLRSADQTMTVQPPPGPDGAASATEVHDLRLFRFEGSALSLLKPQKAAPAIAAVFEALAAFRALDMLSPQAMRQRAKQASDIGYGGERLSAYLHGLRRDQRERIQQDLQTFYPQLGDITTRALQAGWKELALQERYTDTAGRRLETRARHVSDGMLRLLAVLAQLHQSDTPQAQAVGVPLASLLFDEIENGINPELMERLVQHLVQARAQVIVTTHNPVLLNYLSDEVARESVILLYRTPAGLTRAMRLFDLPDMARKLDLLGPGEAYADTDLAALQQQAHALQGSAPAAP